MPAAVPGDGTGRRAGWAMAGVLVLAAAARFYQLGGQSLWFDEVLTVSLSNEPWSRIPKVVRQAEQTPPLLHAIMHVWQEKFGLTDFWLRFPAAVFGTLAVWVTYLLGAALFGRREGCVAALLMAVSGFHVAYSQEARVYSLLLLMSTLSCLAFVKLVREGGRENQVGYVLATGVLYWTHLHAVFVVAAQHLAWAWLMWAPRPADVDRPKITTTRWVLLTVASLAMFAPWMPTVWYWVRSVSKGFWIPPMGPGFLPHAYSLYAGSAVLLVAMAGLGVWGGLRTAERWKIVFVAGLALLPVLAPYVVSLLTRPLFVPRYAIAASVGMFLLAGRGLTALPDRRVRIALLAGLVALSAVSLPRARREIERKPDARGAAWYVADHGVKGDAVLLNAGLENATLLHYLHDQQMERFVLRTDPARVVPPQDVVPSMRLWVISQAPEDRGDRDPAATRPESPVAKLGWHLAGTRPFKGMVVELYATSSEAAAANRPVLEHR